MPPSEISAIPILRWPEVTTIFIGGQRSRTAAARLQSIHGAGHVGIGEEEPDGGFGFKDGDRIVCGTRLEDLLALVCQLVDNVHSDERIILHDQHCYLGGHPTFLPGRLTNLRPRPLRRWREKPPKKFSNTTSHDSHRGFRYELDIHAKTDGALPANARSAGDKSHVGP